MAVDINGIPQVPTEVNQDEASGVLIQDPRSTRSTLSGLTATPPITGQKFYGAPIILGARVGIAADSPAAATTYRATLLNKNAPENLKVLMVGFTVSDITVTDFTDGDAGNLDITFIRGDGAESETESDILADFALDDDYANGDGATFPQVGVALASDVIVSGGSLYVDLVVDPDATVAATNDGATVDAWALCVPIIGQA